MIRISKIFAPVVLLVTMLSVGAQQFQFSEPQKFLATFEDALSRKTPEQEMDSFVRQGTYLKLALIEVIEMINTSLEYWQQQKHAPLSYFIYKGPRGWFDGVKPLEEITTNIATLERYLGHYTEMLGKVSRVVQQHSGVTGRLAVTTEEKAWIDIYKKASLGSIETLKAPGHFKRNWVRYALGGTALGLAAVYGYNNSDKFTKLLGDANTSVQNFWKESLEKPVSKLMKAFWGEESKKEDYLTKAYASEEQELIELFEEIGGEMPNFNANKISSYLDDICRDGSTPIIKDAFKSAVKNSKYNGLTKTTDTLSAWAQVVQLIALQLKAKQLQILFVGMRKANQIDELLESQKMTLHMTALVPAALVIGGASYGLYKALNKIGAMFRSNAKNYQPLRNNLHDIHRILTKYAASEAVTDLDAGRLEFMFHKVSLYTKILFSGTTRDMIAKDVEDLIIPSYTCKQKLAVLDRMYRTYAELLPSTQKA